mgnify:CR=1 FL=1
MAGLEQPRGEFDQHDDLGREWAEFNGCLDEQLAAIPGSADDVDSELFELVNRGERVSAQKKQASCNNQWHVEKIWGRYYCLLSRR